jgi:hypothetical protein
MEVFLDLETFQEVNEVELNCIFAESGADRELDFDYDEYCASLLYSTEYPQLIRKKEKYESN